MKRLWPILFISLVVALLAITNYSLGTFLTGWDNLHPEFSFGANIKRSLFAVWQEYQGLGLLGGMGHASDLLRQLFLAVLSLVIPTVLLRYFWTFLTLLIGSLGAYFLIARIVKNNDANWRATSLLAGLFYLLNLSTIQTYYTIFETFSTHFAALPWLLLATIQAFQKKQKGSLVFLLAVLFLATPSFYVPTLFVVTSIAMFTIAFFLTQQKPLKQRFASVAKLAIIMFVINAFWLLSFTYFTFTNSQTTVHAKINQMATEEIFLKNNEFGNIADVMLLKGFWFNNVEPSFNGGYTYMLTPWRNHLANPPIAALGYAFFAIVLLGFIAALRKRDPLLLGFATLFVFTFAMIATATPPFSWLDTVLRDHVPLFGQVFRFPFTKFSILMSLLFAIFFALGAQSIFTFLQRKNYFPGTNYQLLVTSYVLLVTFLFVFTFPAFQGHLFYTRERLTIPQEYFELFDFFKHQDPHTRIANFPQYSFWGWNYYNWGYSGSGFLWYGIKQPILDRAFDVWSQKNENYYFEVSRAQYAKDPKAIENVLNKYQITWLLVDKNVINPPSPKALFVAELEELLAQIPSVQKITSFGKLDVYKVTLRDKPTNFVFASSNLPSTNTYSWGDLDKAYQDVGNYIARDRFEPQKEHLLYPFRSLFSGKNQEDREFSISETEQELVFEKRLSGQTGQSILTIPAIAGKEKIIPVDVVAQRSGEKLIINLVAQTPMVFLNNDHVWGETLHRPLFEITSEAIYPLMLNVNGVVNLSIDLSAEEEKVVNTTFLTIAQDNIFVLTDKAGRSQSETVPASFLTSLPLFDEQSITISPTTKTVISVRIPKIKDNYLDFQPNIDETIKAENCDNFRRGHVSSSFSPEGLTLSSKNATACVSFYSSSLFQGLGYAIFVDAKNEQGRSLRVWILSEDDKFASIDTYLPEGKKEQHSQFILPPQNPFGKAYSVHFHNTAIGQQETSNTLRGIAMYPIPYNFLTSLLLVSEGLQREKSNSIRVDSVSHPNESLYLVEVPKDAKTLIFSQLFHHCWKAYEVQNGNWINQLFPFIFGKELKEHVLINNWENGWVLDDKLTIQQINNSTIVLVYLPQYLEYVGFGILGITVIWLSVSGLWVFSRRRNR